MRISRVFVKDAVSNEKRWVTTSLYPDDPAAFLTADIGHDGKFALGSQPAAGFTRRR
jgi:hypothetical protein